jgi:1,4-alpha-glucan branching enzyme
MSQGFLHLLLHAHLPYVRHPELDYCLEENWLFEAITESYLPLLSSWRRLHGEGVAFRITLSLSPTLLNMLADSLLQQRYRRYLQTVIAFAEQECARHAHDAVGGLASYHRQRLQQAEQMFFGELSGDLIGAWAQAQRDGYLQLICCAATHGYLPLLNSRPQAVRRQIAVGLQSFAHYFGNKPQGFWLPECAYYPGLEQVLAEQGIAYVYLESHALTLATPPAEYGVYAPVDCGNGVAAFARDPMSSAQVWSAQHGYPGHADYLDFHSDAGNDAAPQHRPYGVLAQHTGCKYWRITDHNAATTKAYYDIERAAQTAKTHAQAFVNDKRCQLQELSDLMPLAPIIVAPFDAELFGHWWHEGPLWLEHVLRCAAETGVATVGAQDYLQQTAALAVCRPAASSWGANGYNEYWLSSRNQWLYPLLDKAEAEFERMLIRSAKPRPVTSHARAVAGASFGLGVSAAIRHG